MQLASSYKIGFILKPHGLKGEVTISLEAEAPEDLETLESLFLEKDGRLEPYFIESISVRGAKAYLKLEDIDSIEDASRISKQSIYLPRNSRPKSEKGEFYDDEVIGFSVYEEDGNELGKIREIIKAGPNKLLALDHNDKEILIPVNGPFITSINKSKKKITVNLPEGFLDI
ncbi:MAG TPA: ribosome maturation factor RimM [Ohtaekwangia sp.]